MALFDRRQLLHLTVGGGAAAFAAAAPPFRTAEARLVPRGPAPTDQAPRFAAEVDAGLAYCRRRAAEQLPLAEALLAAVRTGDLDAATRAYVASRPPYEEIEVLAASFPETDADLDARPYSFDGGESNPDFKGFHRIEALLYRDADPAAAVPHAAALVTSVRTLIADLKRREAFTAELHFEGMIGLANEVAAKKISSEEETWSDQSLLIFEHNWRGIQSQYEPFAPAAARIDPRVAAEVAAASAAAIASLTPYPRLTSGAATPYGSVPAGGRREMVRASYRLRDALSRAGEVLALA